ncbi:MAG: glutamate racemase [bacterium]
MSSQPIGMFDSGVGGTSIWKELHELLPNENTIYLADSKYAPYGNKPQERILELSIKNTELLLENNCKLIVVACNTATTNAIAYLRKTYNVPFIGIEPAIKPAALNTTSKAIGILATQGTLSSALFHKTSELFAKDIEVIEQEGHGIVPLVESGKIDSPEMRNLLKKYLAPMINANIDYLVLGCTHYPYIIPVLKTLLPKHVTIIDSGEAVARQTKHILQQNNLMNQNNSHPELIFYSNSNPDLLRELIQGKGATSYLDF